MRIGSTVCAVVMCAAIGQTAAAQTFHPEIRVAERTALITPSATPIFTCELFPFSSGQHCYGPAAIRAAYGLDAPIAAGFDGKGQTIVLIEAFGSPTMGTDLAIFDAIFGLPAPPSLTQIQMPGSTPFDITDDNQVSWALETSLDVQWAHAMAPGAKLIVVAAKDNGAISLLAAQNYAVDHELGQVMSLSFGGSEVDLPRPVLNVFEHTYHRARQHKMTVIAAAGDEGSTNANADGTLKPFPNVGYPASSPHVTGVGGTSLFFGTATDADPNGTYQGEVVWNEQQAGRGATGGGVSVRFKMPHYQKTALPGSILKAANGLRAVPDVSYTAGTAGGVIVATTFLGGPAFFAVGGTSVGTPQWGAIVAIANQMGGQPIGSLNSRLYLLGGAGLLPGFTHDVTIGNNSVFGVPGYSALQGFDLVTGWGTPKGGLVSLLLSVGDDDDDCDINDK